MSESVDTQQIGEAWLNMLETYTHRNLQQRKKINAFDVYYDDLIADPVTTIQSIHQHFELPWNSQDETAVRIWVNHRPANKYGVHCYDLGDFGLSGSQVEERFVSYYQAHPKLPSPSMHHNSIRN